MKCYCTGFLGTRVLEIVVSVRGLMKIEILAFAIVIIISTIVAGDFSSEKAASNAVILFRKTELKLQLIALLEKDLKLMNVNVVTDSLNNADDYELKNYDAVIILSNITQSNPDTKAADYIKKNNYSNKIVYLSTYENINYPYGVLDSVLDRNRIDAITAASPPKGKPVNKIEIQKARKAVMDKVKIILEGKGSSREKQI